MGMLLIALGGLLSLVGTVCAIIVLIAAFQNAIWKGILGFFCGLYLLYFAFAEWQSDKKGMILAGWLLGGAVGYGLIMAGTAMMGGGAVPATG